MLPEQILLPAALETKEEQLPVALYQMPFPVAPGTKKELTPAALEQIHSPMVPGTEQERSSLASKQMPLLAALGMASQFGDLIFDFLAFLLPYRPNLHITS